MKADRLRENTVLQLMLGEAAVILIPLLHLPIRNLQEIGQGLVVMGWMLSVHRRIINPGSRRDLLRLGSALLLYLILQMAKYTWVGSNEVLRRHLWYSYYIPMTLVPLLVLRVALCMGSGSSPKVQRAVKWLWLPAAPLMLGFLTNDFHQLAFAFPDGLIRWNDDGARHGILYGLFVVWAAVLLLAFLLILIRNSRVGRIRQRCWIPLLPLAFGAVCFVVLILWPTAFVFNGHKLLNIGEIFAIMIIGCLEGAVQTGLLPANSGYVTLFAMSSLPAVITDRNYTPVYQTAAENLPGAELCRMTEGGPCYPSADIHLESVPIPGGYICLQHDLTELNCLNADIRRQMEQIREKNEILRHESETREETLAVEARSALYDRISLSVREPLTALTELLDQANDDEVTFRGQLARISLYAAYIKRRSNMELLANERERLPFAELITAVRESVEYLRLCGPDVLCAAEGEEDFPAGAVIRAYEAFQAVAEACLTASFVQVHMTADGEEIRIRFFISPADGVLKDVDDRLPGGCLLEKMQEDGESILTLRIAAGGGKE